jgi:putative flippase GtrA
MIRDLFCRYELLIRQFISFGLIGTFAFFVDWGTLEAMVYLGLTPGWGRVISYIVAASTTWFLNRHLTFRHAPRGKAAQQWVKFVVVNLGGFALNYGTFIALITFVPLARDILGLAVAAGSVAGLGFNFFAARKLVFK